MNRKIWSMVICALFLVAASAFSKHHSASIPSGFTGNVLLEMGVNDAPPLEERGTAYVVPAPRNGKIIASTLLTNSQPTFQNSSEGAVRGYSHSAFTTGDGIPIGGRSSFSLVLEKSTKRSRA
jgi:hypothetical protein